MENFLVEIRKIKFKIFNFLNNILKELEGFFFFLVFNLHKIPKKTVLVCEANNSHTELFPSYVKYLKDINYNVEILAMPSQIGFLPNLSCKKFYCTLNYMKKIFHSKKVKNYDFIFFTSYRLYFAADGKNAGISTLKEHFGNLDEIKKIITSHHKEDYEEIKTQTKAIVVLSDILAQEGTYTINPCYFKEQKIKNKNKKTKFITVGTFNKRKSEALLFKTFEKLVEKEKNFEIVICGGCKPKVPKNLEKHVKIKGRLNFKKLYKELDKADFYLSLLDFENKDHKRYIENGTSGSFQLIKGFLIPPVIDFHFAVPHGFNDDNAIVYEGNDALLCAAKRAIKMNNEEYKKMQENLLDFRTRVEEKSKENLKKAINSLF